MKRKRKASWLLRLFCLLMALHVPNLSIDPPDQHVRRLVAGNLQEDLSINDMKSVGEWVLEHIFDIMVAEHDEPDEDGKVENPSIKLVLYHRSSFVLLPASLSVNLMSAFFNPFISLAYQSKTEDVSSPPPRQR